MSKSANIITQITYSKRRLVWFCILIFKLCMLAMINQFFYNSLQVVVLLKLQLLNSLWFRYLTDWINFYYSLCIHQKNTQNRSFKCYIGSKYIKWKNRRKKKTGETIHQYFSRLVFADKKKNAQIQNIIIMIIQHNLSVSFSTTGGFFVCESSN